MSADRGPIFNLVKAEPHLSGPPRSNVAEHCRPLLDKVKADGTGEWFRLALYPTTGSAAGAKKRLIAAFPDEWQFATSKFGDAGQVGLHARWLGPKGRRS